MSLSSLPQVTVCLPVFNGQRFLSAAIESVLAQTFDDFELVIADDASSDASPGIIEKYASQDKRIVHWRNKTNLGLFANYNECMRRATGTYIKLFAQDDLFDQTMLARLVAELKRDDAISLISCARRVIDDAGVQKQLLREKHGTKKYAYDEVLQRNLLELVNHIGEPSTVMFRRAAVGSGFDTGLYHLGDIEYWFRVIGNNQYLYLDEVLCSFRAHSGSATSKNARGLRFALDMIRLGRKYRNFLESQGVTEEAYSRQIAEATASHLKFLTRHHNMTLQDLLSVDHEDIQEMKEDLACFKEILFYSLLSTSDVLEENYALKREWEEERNRLENHIARLLQSRSWKLTVPLRSAFKILRSHPGS